MPFSHQDLVQHHLDLCKQVRLMHLINKHQQKQIDFLLKGLDPEAVAKVTLDFEKKHLCGCCGSEVKTSNKSKQ